MLEEMSSSSKVVRQRPLMQREYLHWREQCVSYRELSIVSIVGDQSCPTLNRQHQNAAVNNISPASCRCIGRLGIIRMELRGWQYFSQRKECGWNWFQGQVELSSSGIGNVTDNL